MPPRGRRLPLAIVVAFVASFLLLLGGIYHTAYVTSNRDHDVSFDPPVPAARHGRSLKNTSIVGNSTFAKKRVAAKRERIKTNKTALTKDNVTQEQDIDSVEEPIIVVSNDDILNATLLDKGENVTVTDLRPKSFPHVPQVPFLGVLVDAGRHYFPLEWLKDLIDVLARMNFNLIHFRLTDDQAFNVNLTSHPELAKPSAVNNPSLQVYSVAELVDLVAYAAEKNITIMPEINVPGHAGGWSGIPGFLVPCPEFICLKGYGIPLNLAHPQMLDVIKDVIMEVRDIFQTSPYLHLGGDEVEMSAACFYEAGIPMFNYTDFEAQLEGILVSLNISTDYVLRWEMTPGRHQVNAEDRAGKMTHWWVGHEYKQATNETAKPWFVSQGLYFDSNRDENGWSIYQQALLQASLENPPTAIVGGTFELSTITWVDRNVLGRLLAVAMGAAKLEYNTTEAFEKNYLKYCHLIGIDERQCSALGMPVLHQQSYMTKWNLDWDVWKGDICQRLTVEHIEPIMNQQDHLKDMALQQASQEFWNSFGLEHPVHRVVKVPTDNGIASVGSLPELAVDHLGLVVDLVHGTSAYPPQERFETMKGIIDDMAKLGFNLLQLRIMDEFGMSLQLHSLPDLAIVTEGRTIWDTESMKSVVRYASTKGIRVMPEISMSTRAGGWANAGILAACPNVICGRGQGIAMDTTDSTVMQIFALVIRELKGLFSSQFIHLGHDERKEAMACYKEANVRNPNLDEWEHRLEAVLRLEGVVGEHVLRWENTEHILFPHRAGLITNYRDLSSLGNSTAPFFVTTDLSDTTATAWNIYQQTNEIMKAGPSGIMASIEVVENWDSLQIRERLLSVSMGARKMELNDASSLRTTFLETCKTLELKNCESFVSPNATEVSHQLDLETKRALWTADLCEAVTTKKTVKMPRKGVLILN